MNLVKASGVSSLLCLLLIATSSTALSQLVPQTLYFTDGKQLTCDQAWLEGDTVFVVPQGKRFAISYEKREIDLRRSSVRILDKPASPPASQATTDVIVKPKSGEKSILRIYHHEYSLAPRSHEPDPVSNASSSVDVEQSADGASSPTDTPIKYGVGKQSYRTGTFDSKSLHDEQMPRQANPNYKHEYQKKLREYEAAKRKSEQEYQKKLREYEAAKKNYEQEYQKKLREYAKSKREVKQYNAQVDAENERIRKQNAAKQQQNLKEWGSNPKPYLHGSHRVMGQGWGTREPQSDRNNPEMQKGQR